MSQPQDNVDEAFEALGREIASQLTTPMDEHVDSAVDKLEDDDIVAFGLVAIRNNEDGVQSAMHRAIDPDIVQESRYDSEEVIDAIHGHICHVWDEEVATR